MTGISYALRQSMKNGYSLKSFRQDAVAALIVSLVALPLSMALSIAVGLPPQNGIYTAIVAGIVVPLLGGSITQVSGPTAAFVVIVAPIVTQYGLHGLIITELLAGIILIILGITKLGRYINFIPYPVTIGFTSGIAVVIGTLALNDFLGLGVHNLQGSYIHKVSLLITAMPTLHWPEAFIGAFSLLFMFSPGRITKFIPAPIIGIAVGTLGAYILGLNGFNVATIGSNFSYDIPGGGIGHGIPPFPPTFHLPGDNALFAMPNFAELKILIIPALVIAALGALESLLSATVADGLAGTKHEPNSELVAIGIGNILSGLASGIPATGAIARTATNIHGGAKTPLASCMHAILIMLYVMLFARFISYIPMPALSALLISVAYRMSHYKQFIRTIKIAQKSDVIVLVICFALTVFIDMVAGVLGGVILACALFIKRIANLTETNISQNGGSNVKNFELPPNVMVYHISGLLFFGTAEKALSRSGLLQYDIRTLIIDIENVPFIDMTGLVAMKTLILDLQGNERSIIICGNRTVTDKILQKLPASARTKLSFAPSVKDALKTV